MQDMFLFLFGATLHIHVITCRSQAAPPQAGSET